MGQILLVEDDRAISDMVRTYLVNEGFQVVTAFTGTEAVKKMRQKPYDLVLLDLMLPELNGMDVLQQLREKSYTPVIIMSAKDGDADKALGLGFGADDYVTKPFSMIELVARVKAVIRRSTTYQEGGEQTPSVLRVHELEMDLDGLVVRKNEDEISLTSKEWKILKLLLENQKRVLTKEQIYQAVWDDHYYGDEHVINVHVSRLREKIEDDLAKPAYIKTVWGIGYKLGEFK
ncbi:response regulator transcription factor [Alkalicoccobacillus gibsonii]|jgi:DNA-binding response OmpR family regulator|uniref:Response regulator transcription factor n=1 Tax=Alkalicoccobacillus gibsonii TaxID=79881 RepID=A0ABU9VMI4_9BACI